jgi:hypothetical protein
VRMLPVTKMTLIIGRTGQLTSCLGEDTRRSRRAALFGHRLPRSRWGIAGFRGRGWAESDPW